MWHAVQTCSTKGALFSRKICFVWNQQFLYLCVTFEPLRTVKNICMWSKMPSMLRVYATVLQWDLLTYVVLEERMGAWGCTMNAWVNMATSVNFCVTTIDYAFFSYVKSGNFFAVRTVGLEAFSTPLLIIVNTSAPFTYLTSSLILR